MARSGYPSILYACGPNGLYKTQSGGEAPPATELQAQVINDAAGNGNWTRFVRRLAAQPKELILDITEQHPDGRRFERRMVLEKQ